MESIRLFLFVYGVCSLLFWVVIFAYGLAGRYIWSGNGIGGKLRRFIGLFILYLLFTLADTLIIWFYPHPVFPIYLLAGSLAAVNIFIDWRTLIRPGNMSLFNLFFWIEFGLKLYLVFTTFQKYFMT
jgi:hypothetical protein